MATEVKLPEVGEGIESGTVVGVLVKVGDRIAEDQPVIELETDKAVVEVPSTAAGVVASIEVKENQEAKIGQVILTVDAGDAAASGAQPGAAEGGREAAGGGESQGRRAAPDEAAATRPAGDGGDRRPAEERPAGGSADREERASAGGPRQPRPSGGAAASDGRSTSGGGALVPAAPSVRRLARELGVEIEGVHGSGILGRVSASDVRAAAEGASVGPAGGGAAAPARPAPLPDFSRWGAVERKPMSGIRKATVRTMANAWSTVPMVTQFDKADITEFEALRQRFKPQAQKLGAKLTPTAMLLKVVAAALKRFPDFNASIDTGAGEIVYKSYVNIGVAVDTDAGLLVPVIRDADRKNILELARELGELADKARARKLTPDDMQGGNFSVSNLGGIGGTGFTPIVNPPEVAILGVSRASHEPVYDEAGGTFRPRLLMPLSVSYDHRLIDGAAAARFLRWLCEAIEEPFLMALEG